jgi:hypothetical protein
MPILGIRPMFTNNVCRNIFTIDSNKINNLRSYCFRELMVRQGVVPLTKAVIGNGAVVDHCLIISKHVGHTIKRNPKYRNVQRNSTIWLTTILAATNCDPKVTVYTHACRLEYQSSKVWLQKCKPPVTD